MLEDRRMWLFPDGGKLCEVLPSSVECFMKFGFVN